MRKGFTLMVMGATALSSIASSAAWADTIPEPTPAMADSATIAEMQQQCDALATLHETDNDDRWTGVIVPGAVTKVSGPTEVDGSRIKDMSTVTPAGDYVPSVKEIRGNPYRVGGSVNMFGNQWSTAGYFPDSTYYYQADFDSTFSHAFSCNIMKEAYHEGETIHHRAVGSYTLYNDYHGNDENAVRRNCEQLSDTGQEWWGMMYRPTDDVRHCEFVGTPAYDETLPGGYDAPMLVANEPGQAVEQEQTDSLRAFEDHGGRVDVTGEHNDGQVVVCISPAKPTPGGTWRQQNGYTGDKCTTTYFQSIVPIVGSTTSQGTFTSVPNYVYP